MARIRLIRKPCATGLFVLGMAAGFGSVAGMLRAQRSPAAPAAKTAEALTIDYPGQDSLFPPDIAAPTFLWRDSAPHVAQWHIEVAFGDGGAAIQVDSKGALMKLGEIDERCNAISKARAELTPQQAVTHTWTPEVPVWAAIKRRSVQKPATVTITGFANGRRVSTGRVSIATSKDPVGAPVFYRDVPLAPSEGEKGFIRPLAPAANPLIAWRLRNVGDPASRIVLTGMRLCANCHSFSADGKTLGMDLDGPQNDKGLYALAEIQPEMQIRTQDIVNWNRSQDRQYGESRVGFMSQVSPDGRYVVTTISGTSRPLSSNFYVVNFKDYRFLQVFYPTGGILAWYDRTTGQEQPLPGADDPHFAQTDGVWSPDGKFLVFARAAARPAYPPGAKRAEYANDPAEVQIQYDLYRIPFNEGRGGQPEPIRGASANGMSNTFPKVSPDGRWIVFVKCKNGQLMRPDSELYIVPAEGGEARRLACNTSLMNSWHSFSPNGRWLVFSSKNRSPYTQLYLTHLDEQGNASPAILIEHSTAANRAANIPEFVNIPPDGLRKINVPAVDFYNQLDVALALNSKRQYPEAIPELKKALELDPNDARALVNLGIAQAATGAPDEAAANYRKAIQAEPKNAGGYLAMGDLMEAQGTPGEAVAYYGQALELRPDDARLHNRMGMALADSGHAADAIAQYRRALELDPAHADTFAHLGEALVRAGQFYEAMGLLAESLESNPNDSAAESSLGVALLRTGRVEDGLEHCRKAVTLNANDAEAETNLAVALANSGQREEALTHFEKAAGLAPGSARYQGNLGAALAQQGRVGEAVPHFQAAVEANPRDVQALANLAMALATTGKVDEAIPVLEQAARLAPADPDIQANLGAALVGRGRMEAAIPHLEQALKAAPGDASAHYYLGSALASTGRPAEGVREWRAALSLQRDFVPAMFRLADLLSSSPDDSLRNGAEAVELAERAANLTRGQEPSILDTLAAAYAEAGRFAEAITAARRALTLAVQLNDKALAAGVNARIALYEAQKPFRAR
ncbi:MAG: tetratricopeptide repeat protein [Bryobacteraceae bacterium]|nr:tetratricopeptide repeat protein [Bryobacteraceae bacterium]